MFAGGHPQRTMLLAYLLADRLTAGEEPTPEWTARVVDDAVERVAPGYRVLWPQAGAAERVVLAAVADGRGPTSRSLADEHSLGRSTLNAAADRLADQGHLLRKAHRSRLVDPLPAEWVRRR